MSLLEHEAGHGNFPIAELDISEVWRQKKIYTNALDNAPRLKLFSLRQCDGAFDSLLR